MLQITEAARSRLELGGHIELLYEKDGKEFYICAFDEEMTIGAPEVYVWDGKEVKTVSGEEAWALMPSIEP